jgi:hypothetical protein
VRHRLPTRGSVWGLSCALALAAAAGVSHAAVLTGPLQRVPESFGDYSWGDGQHNLRQEYSAHDENRSGWFYGSSTPWFSNADVFNAGPIHPLTVADASAFPYLREAIVGSEGDTIFFRGTNSYYGAWVLEHFTAGNPDVVPHSYLDGRWYFQSDGTARFPEPGGAAALLVAAATWCARYGRRSRSSRRSTSAPPIPCGTVDA